MIFDETNEIVPIRISFQQQKSHLAPKRLEDAGFELSENDTPEDGNCLIHALRDQMRYIVIFFYLS